MRYCTTCFYPDTKPDIRFDEDGKCSACAAFEYRRTIDWEQRERDFANIANKLRNNGSHQYHCVVPVSGGKDSHYQILKVKEYGLNPLAVCAHTDMLSGIGRDNLTNITKLGVDFIEVSVNPRVRRRINSHTLREIGDVSWAEHITIFSIPVRIASHFNAPLIIWGENPQNEYGGPTWESQQSVELDKRWLSEFGGLLGLRASDLIDAGVATREDLYLYTYPSPVNTELRGIFLGQFFPWDGANNALLASQHGFRSFPYPVEGTGYTYENLDNLQTGVHDYMKWLKYGYGRCTDMVNNHIRRGNISRDEGRKIILQYDGAYPATYLGISLEKILEPLKLDVEEFVTICNKFTNNKLFEITPNRPRPRPLFLDDLKHA